MAQRTIPSSQAGRWVQSSVSRAHVSLLFRAFSDPTRLRILHLVSGEEVCVGDLVKILGVPQPTASRHLTYLRRAGVVSTRKSGQWIYYSLAPAAGKLHTRLLGSLDDCKGEMPELATDAKRFRELKKTGGCCAVPAGAAQLVGPSGSATRRPVARRGASLRGGVPPPARKR